MSKRKDAFCRFDSGYWIEATDDINDLEHSAEFYLHLYEVCQDRINEIKSKNHLKNEKPSKKTINPLNK